MNTPTKYYAVIEMAPNVFAIGTASPLPGVDYKVSLGGMDRTTAFGVVDELNSRGHIPEELLPVLSRDFRFRKNRRSKPQSGSTQTGD